MKIKYKITLAFTLLTAMVLALLCFITYFNTASQHKEDFTKRLRNRAMTVSSIFSHLPLNDFSMLYRMDSATTNLLTSENVSIYNKQNERIYRFAKNYGDTLNISDAFIEKARANGKATGNENGRSIVAVYFPIEASPIVILVSAYDKNGAQNLKELKRNLMIGFFSGVIIAFIVGWMFSKRMLQPITRISRIVNNISATNIEHRLATGTAKDEWYQLTSTFNDLLARLQQSFEIQGRFIANASHELSTPLTSISNQIDVVLRKERGNEDYLKVLRSVKSDVEQMMDLTQQLLNIARTSRGGAIQPEPVRIDELLMELPARVKKINPLYIVNVFFDELPDDEKLFTVNGSFELLFSAFKNIAENGCKYSPGNLSNISLSFIADRVIIIFTNKSEIREASEIENIFQPFQRGANALHLKGYGLGLSLTRRIILLHKGEIKAELTESGDVMISIILPSSFRKF
ncbi:MAG: histidine kinase dimerization/phospho-acceptor domain-containing protein [Ferruginibacter sp.]